MSQEVYPAQELQGVLQLPADKSISHRSVMFASLHDGKSTISNFSEAADPHSTIGCLRALGVSIRQVDDEARTVEVHGVGRDGLQSPDAELDCGNSGTTMRLLSGIIAGAGVDATLIGDESLSSRTMKRIIDPLTDMGADIDARDNDYAPLQIQRNGALKPLHFPLPIPSAQLKSCVLLAGLFGDEPTTVVETKISRDHTERLLQLPIKEEEDRTIISSSRNCEIPAQNYRIPNDFSAAAFWIVAAAIHPNAEITLKNVGLNPTRIGALNLLKEMGVKLEITEDQSKNVEPRGDISVARSQLSAIDITEDIVPNCIDEIPILAIAMLFADGRSTIRGAEELRHKETDRLAAVADMLSKAGADFEEFEDGFEINGSPGFRPDSATYKSYDDHRIAMSAAVLSLMGQRQSRITQPECTAISYPSFWDDLAHLTN